jgi:anti-sigma B factor antagonist
VSPSIKPPQPRDDIIHAASLGNATILFRVQGLGNMHNAIPLADFADSAMKTGARRFAFDLSGCEGMDSTFMGTLVGIALSVRETTEGWVCLLNTSPANRELLEIVGADKFFLFDASLAVNKELGMTPLPNVEMSAEGRLRLVRKAHENLAEINKYNEKQFGSILRSMSAELDRKAAESGLFESLGGRES